MIFKIGNTIRYHQALKNILRLLFPRILNNYREFVCNFEQKETFKKYNKNGYSVTLKDIQLD